MDKQKSTRLKDPQTSAISTVLAQFDIQTQVNKMVARSFDTLMRTNKQAFDFIKQSESKFISFEQRLSKAETYYQNIEMNVNSKIELTDNMNKCLQQFSTQFWNSMKENNNEIIGMNKRFDQLNLEKKTLQNGLNQAQKNIKRLQSTFQNLNDKINKEIGRMEQTIKENQTKIQGKLFEQKKQLRQLNTAIIESRSLLQSKSGLLTDLLQDLQIYKNDRPQIMHQLQKIFQELENRTMKFELIQMRGYVDSKIVAQAERVNNLCLRLDTQIKLEERQRKRQDTKIIQSCQQNIENMNASTKQMQNRLSTEIDELNVKIISLSDKTNSEIQSVNIEVSEIRQKYEKQIPQVTNKSLQNKTSLEEAFKKLTSCQNQLKQMYSNIESANQMIDIIMKQNNQRRQEMSNLKANSQSQGNVNEQVLNLFEKIDILTKKIAELQRQTTFNLSNLTSGFQSSRNQSEQTKQSLLQAINIMSKNLQQSTSKTQAQFSALDTSLSNSIAEVEKRLGQRVTQNKRYIAEKILNIKDQLDELDKIHQEIKQFKDTFKKQIQQNDKVNLSVAEKMERVMALFTKLKSDNSVKFQQLTSDLQRRAAQLKACLADLDQIKKYLSLSNQCISLLLAFGTLKDTVKQTSSNHTGMNLQVPNDPKQSSHQDQSSKPIKITSILEGWVLESDQNHQKIRYRGQYLTSSSRSKLAQISLQLLVKHTEKIKGSILQNGKDIFMRIVESSEEIFQQRKKANSKRRPSQLPKLYM